MIFDNPAYFLLLALTLPAYFLLPWRFRPHVLWVTGMAFYALFAGRYFPLMFALTLAAFWPARRRRLALWVVGLVATLLVTRHPGLWSPMVPGVSAGVAAVVVPLGISYVVLELIGYRVDLAKGKIAGARWPDYLAFIWFFPCRIAGPIRRYGDFVSAVAESRFTAENLYHGVLRIAIGFAKKYCVADVAALTVSQLADYNAVSWSPVIAYSIYIYFDFSAYSDIAIGSSRLFGVVVPENFNYPYLKPNIREFWASWHMSLTAWLRDYVFLNTGKALFGTSLRRAPTLIAAIAYMITFAVCGLWHGSAANFLVWGLFHGSLLGLHHAYRAYLPRRVAMSAAYNSRAASVVSAAVTFGFVTLGFVLFRYDLPRALDILKHLLGPS